jgi:hypothetical protein
MSSPSIRHSPGYLLNMEVNMRHLKGILILIGCLCLFGRVSAQDTTVPNIVGLGVPQAAAELNRAGLRLGVQTSIGWTEASGLVPNTISEQSVAPDGTTAAGTIIDVTVLRAPNIALVYDDNDLTVINLTDDDMNVSGLSFASTEGTAANFAASRWTGVFDGDDCGQIWSIGRNAPKEVEGCDLIHWLTTNKTEEHFWTTANGVVRFGVLDNGLERAVCAAAPANSQDQPLRCEAYIAGGTASSDLTQYVYYAYTMDAFVLVNPSPDKWMLTNQTMIFNYNPNIQIQGAEVPLGDPALFNHPATVANLSQLAPRQCLLLTSDNPTAAPPESCDVIAQLDLTANVAFWLADFQIEGATDDVRRQCPAAVAEKTTICVMPR